MTAPSDAIPMHVMDGHALKCRCSATTYSVDTNADRAECQLELQGLPLGIYMPSPGSE